MTRHAFQVAYEESLDNQTSTFEAAFDSSWCPLCRSEMKTYLWEFAFLFLDQLLQCHFNYKNQNDIPQYERLCKSCQVNAKSQDGRRERENYVLSIMKNLLFPYGLCPFIYD